MTINPQKKLFEKIHQEYASHYYSKGALLWKKRIIWDFIKKNGINLDNANMAEFFCGSGFNTFEILSFSHPKITVGYDISELAVNDFIKLTGKEAFVKDLTVPFMSPYKFDVIFVFGGLHHAYYLLPSVLENISNNLNENGKLVVFEPSRGTIWDALRNIWYRFDKYFDEKTEHALLPADIERHNFKLSQVKYITGPAYMLIYNSLILRIPIVLADLIAAPLTLIDQLLSLINSKFFSFCFVAVFLKEKPKPAESPHRDS